MSNEVRGVDVLIKHNGVAVAGQRDCTISIKGDKIDTTTKTNAGYKTSLQGLKEWSISIDHVNYIGEDAEGQRALKKAFLDGDNVDIVAAVGEEEVYTGEASISGLDISGAQADVSTSAFTLEGAGALSYEFAPEFSSVAVSGVNTVATITLSETVLNNLEDTAALKTATTFASDGTTFAALGASDTIVVTDGEVIVTFDSAFTGSANVLKIDGSSLKTTNGAIQTQAITTSAFAAA